MGTNNMSTINNSLAPTINKLVKALGIKLYTYKEILESSESNELTEVCEAAYGGFYSITKDKICIDENVPELADEIVLHEIVHWSGSKNRLNREFINNNFELTEKDIHTEEAIAHIGMLKVSLVLGLNPAKYSESALKRLKKLPLADMVRADKESDRAVRYIMSFMEVQDAA